MKIISENKKIRHEYTILDTLEAGIILQGTEIKSIRLNNCIISDCYVGIKNNEAYLYNMHIPHFSHGNINNHQENRTRKLLLNKKEINQINSRINKERITVVVSKLYLKDGKAKIEIALAKGKNLHDKRQSEKKKDDYKKIRIGNYE